jgi:hypothetical protein
VTNALIHAFDGRDDGEMSVNSRLLNEKQVEIVFADNGVGISEADQKRVFDPFFTTRLGQGGSGLGMHIVYNLVTDVLGVKFACKAYLVPVPVLLYCCLWSLLTYHLKVMSSQSNRVSLPFLSVHQARQRLEFSFW